MRSGQTRSRKTDGQMRICLATRGVGQMRWPNAGAPPPVQYSQSFFDTCEKVAGEEVGRLDTVVFMGKDGARSRIGCPSGTRWRSAWSPLTEFHPCSPSIIISQCTGLNKDVSRSRCLAVDGEQRELREKYRSYPAGSDQLRSKSVREAGDSGRSEMRSQSTKLLISHHFLFHARIYS